MKKDALKRSFDLTSFESLTISSEELKGGFSPAYSGGIGSLTSLALNVGRNCACTFTGNCVTGCACPPPTPTPTIGTISN